MISCYVIAELKCIDILKQYIERFPLTKFSGYSKVDSVDFSKIAQFNPNILFVDISILNNYRSKILKIGQYCTIIYLDKVNTNAYEAYEACGFDYLANSIAYERFEMSMNKFINLSLLVPLPNYKRLDTIRDSFFIKSDTKGQKEILIKCEDVIFIEAQQNYVVLHLEYGRRNICHNTMKEMEESLPDKFFVRVHKSYIINYNKVTYIEGNNIILNENENYKVLIGNTYRKAFLEIKNQKMIKKKSFFQGIDYSITASLCFFYSAMIYFESYFTDLIL